MVTETPIVYGHYYSLMTKYISISVCVYQRDFHWYINLQKYTFDVIWTFSLLFLNCYKTSGSCEIFKSKVLGICPRGDAVHPNFSDSLE